jgi:trans-aconitate methyltransferase
MPPVAEAVRALRAPDADGIPYLQYHRRRYEYLMDHVGRLLEGFTGRARVLDIGMSHQTLLLRALHPEAELETLGYYDHRFPRMEEVRHTDYDLNDAADEARWPEMEPYDLIVLAEVIEHLYAPPTRVLRMLRRLLRPGGALLIQTPNAVNLRRRLALLRGHSPFEMIRDDMRNPGHYCEYTVENLMELARAAGLETGEYAVRNYFGEREPLYDLLCAALPGRMADGITMVLRRPHS